MSTIGEISIDQESSSPVLRGVDLYWYCEFLDADVVHRLSHMPHLLVLSKTKPTKVCWLKQGKTMLNNDGVPILFIELTFLKGVLLHAWLE